MLSPDEILAEAPEKDAETVPAPATPPGQEDPVSADYVLRTVAGVLGDLDKLEALAPGDRTERGDGWDSGCFAVACQLVRAANSGTDYTIEQAEKDFKNRCPTDDGFGPDRVAHKWSDALEKAGDDPLHPQNPSADEDFGPYMSGKPKNARPRSWCAVDLSCYLDGRYTPPRPTLLRRTDDVCLLYPGLTHSIHGEPESGKSFLVQYEAARLIMEGQFVLYVDFESDAGSLAERLTLLGATRRAIEQRFTYVRPETNPSQGEDANDFAAMLNKRYALAVIDGVSESMAVMGTAGTDPNSDAIDWATRLPRRIADATGAAVVQIDHVTKNSETRGRWAIGGQAKLSALTGAAYMVEVREPLGRGRRGALTLWVAKDRPGFVRGHSGARRPDGVQQAAEVVVDSTGEHVEFTVSPPALASVGDEALEKMKVRIAEFLNGAPGASLNKIRNCVDGNNSRKGHALNSLVADGYVQRDHRGQATLHTLVRPYAPELQVRDLGVRE